MSWELDLNIGRFDIESGSHDGEISWDLRRAQSAPANKSAPRDEQIRATMLQVVKDTSGTLTASQVVERVGGSKDHRWEAFNELKGTHIDVRKVTRLEGKRDVERDLCFYVPSEEDDQ